MTNVESLVQSESLAFFGRVNASISHELKNIMAIISETSGLMGDLCEIAEDGGQYDPKTFKNLSASITEEIQRGFVTIKQMNRFAHSMDSFFADVKIVDLVELMLSLSSFVSYSSNVSLTLPKDKSLTISSSPFLLELLIYEALIFGYKRNGKRKDIAVSVSELSGGGVGIRFENITESGDEVYIKDNIIHVAKAIGVSIDEKMNPCIIDMVIPKEINEK